MASREPKEDVDNSVEKKELDVDKDVLSYFVGTVSTEQHYAGQEKNRDRYAAGMAVLQKNRVEIAQSKYPIYLPKYGPRHDKICLLSF